jgi:hypothetical protein
MRVASASSKAFQANGSDGAVVGGAGAVVVVEVDATDVVVVAGSLVVGGALVDDGGGGRVITGAARSAVHAPVTITATPATHHRARGVTACAPGAVVPR